MGNGVAGSGLICSCMERVFPPRVFAGKVWGCSVSW